MENKLLKKAFDEYYSKGMEALDKNQLDVAKRNIYNAAELSLKMAKESNGELKKKRLERADELVLLAKKIEEKQNVEINTTNKNNVSCDLAKFEKNTKAVNKDDNTQTSFETSEKTGVMLSDVAGLEDAKKEIERKVLAPLKHPELFEKYKISKGGGILLYGVPGTGKTMFAQAIANELDAAFFSVKCSDIASKWFGESEQNIKNLFASAKEHPFSIIFFDEFEALGAKRDSHSTVMKRLVPELLSQMQGFEKNKNTILLIAATNRPWDIDSAFLRPGRFNTRIYVPIPDEAARKAIITKQLLNVPLSEDFDIDKVIYFTDKFNGADVVEFCDKLKSLAFEKAVETGKDEPINDELIEKVALLVKSSVRKEDLKKIEEFETSIQI